jgi:hypothetical protein
MTLDLFKKVSENDEASGHAERADKLQSQGRHTELGYRQKYQEDTQITVKNWNCSTVKCLISLTY